MSRQPHNFERHGVGTWSNTGGVVTPQLGERGKKEKPQRVKGRGQVSLRGVALGIPTVNQHGFSRTYLKVRLAMSRMTAHPDGTSSHQLRGPYWLLCSQPMVPGYTSQSRMCRLGPLSPQRRVRSCWRLKIEAAFEHRIEAEERHPPRVGRFARAERL